MTDIQSASLHFIRITHKTCWSFIRVQTSDRRVGEGEASLTGREDLLLDAAERIIPIALREASHKEPSRFAQQNSPKDIAESGIVSAIDQALWSLNAQAENQSLAQTLGVYREHVPVYANINRRTEDRGPGGFADSAHAAMEAGHVAFKIAPFDEVNVGICAEGNGLTAMQTGLDRIFAVRQVIGPDARLMIDCHWRFDEDTASMLNEAAAKLGIHWVECPMPEIEENIPALSRLRHQCNELGMHHAGLETNIGWDTVRPFCEGGAYDVVMPDIKYIGGIHELQRTADGCSSLGIQLSPHNPSGPVAHAASLQVSASIADFDMLELQFDESPLFNELVGVPFAAVEDGHTVLPEGSGLGIHLIETVMQQHLDQPVREWR